MIRELELEQESYKSRLYHFHGMQQGNTGRHVKSMSVDQLAFRAGEASVGECAGARSYVGPTSNTGSSEKQQTGWSIHRGNENGMKPPVPDPKPKQPSDLEMMKEKFAKLLLGEDMSGGGKGVPSALALSNAITNLAASVFGEQKRLGPMAPDSKARWKKEIDWLLCVTDHIVEFVPSQQQTNGVNMEIMTTKQRTDLQLNIPALRKLDAMLLDCLDNFKDQNEFYYIKKEDDNSEGGNDRRKDNKWWLPTCKVPPNGLSEMTRRWLQFQKDSVNQVLKAAMAINAQVLSEMEIPENYIESLPKNGRSSLGDSIYKGITVEYFDPDEFLSTMDLTSEHKILDLKNRIEASIVIWRRKMNSTKDSKSHWGSAVSLEKRELFEERAETVLLLLKQRFPGIPQSALDISKIQYNGDVGQAILESYSRVIESLAFTVLSRIDDVIYADLIARNPSQASFKRKPLLSTSSPEPEKLADFGSEVDKLTTVGTPNSMTLLDFMGWNGADQGEAEEKHKDFFMGDELLRDPNKNPPAAANKKVSYLERIENLSGSRSPTMRH